MHQALYRKWRPVTFGGVYGQEQVISVLRYEVAAGKVSHAYLFCGPRGTGKTSCARLLAKAVNCESPEDGEPCGKCSACKMIEDGTATDVLELDAASNNGVENVRDIRDEVVYTPAVLKRRVYIVDEVHMLSTSAFNALLKTLEEPPEHVVFILATTEPHKIPATIISRCQRFDFRRLENRYIVEYLTKIAEGEGIALDADAARLIARLSQGGMRDAISTLELCASDGARVTEEAVRAIAGVAGRGLLVKTVAAVREGDVETIFAAVDELYSSSLDVAVFWTGLVTFYRDMLVINATKNASAYLELTTSEFEETGALARRFTREELAYQSELADEALVRMSRSGSSKRLIAELTLIKMSDPRLGGDIGALAGRVAALESAVSRGDGIAATPVRTNGARMDRPVSSVPTDAPAFAQDAAGPGASGEGTPEVPPEEAPAARATPESTPKPKGTAPKTLAAYLRWADAVEKYSEISGGEGTASFLRLAEAFCDCDGYIIRADSPLTLDFINTDEVRTRLASIIGALDGRKTEPSAIRIEAAKRDAGRSAIDEIII